MGQHIKPYEAQKVVDAIKAFKASSKDDKRRVTAQSVVQTAFSTGVLSDEAGKKFGLDKKEFMLRMPNSGLGLDHETRERLFVRILSDARKSGAKIPAELTESMHL